MYLLWIEVMPFLVKIHEKNIKSKKNMKQKQPHSHHYQEDVHGHVGDREAFANLLLYFNKTIKDFKSEIQNLHCTDDGEPSEKSHSASYC